MLNGRSHEFVSTTPLRHPKTPREGAGRDRRERDLQEGAQGQREDRSSAVPMTRAEAKAYTEETGKTVHGPYRYVCLCGAETDGWTATPLASAGPFRWQCAKCLKKLSAPPRKPKKK